MDEIDRAQEQEESQRDFALRNQLTQRRKTEPLLVDGEHVCIGCFEPIELRRLAAIPDADRCMQCQEDLEKYQWTGP